MAIWSNKKCRCYPYHSDYPTYCPVHDGDYSQWKFGQNGEDFDEYPDKYCNNNDEAGDD